MFDVVVLGIDPGLTRCGYGVVAQRQGQHTALAAGVIRTSPETDLPERLAALALELEAIVTQYQPNVMAVERVLFQVNVRSAMATGQASGVAMLTGARANVPVVGYSPNEVKLAVAGHGGAGKPEMQRMVKALLHLDAIPEPADAADALALALCHLAHAPMRAIQHGVAPNGRLAAAIASAERRDRMSEARSS
jgi:crossover junction endodeoxyribonuclease RuvC